ncbi:MAG: serine/threonine-protein phosphatase [Treponema sp.]|nr:serine/threonine-protein phosphatase [Treponema sp.]
MIYIILNFVLLALLIYFAHYLDTKIKGNNFEISAFSISLLFACIEAGFFILASIFSGIWLDSITTHLMRIVFVFDALFFIQISFSFITISNNKRKGIKRLIKFLLTVFAIYLVYGHFKSVQVSVANGVIIESEYLFPPEARQYFPWTWVTLYTSFFRYFLPIICYLSLLVLQESNATQIEHYQTFLLGVGIIIMWVTNYVIQFISIVSPSFNLLFMYAYLFMITTLFSAWTKNSVPSGKGILVSVLKAVLSFIVPALIIGVLSLFAQPLYTNFKLSFVLVFSAASIILIFYSIAISELLGSSSKFYSSDYEKTLEKQLASIDYTNGEMDQIANRMYEIMKRSVETSSMDVFILNNQGELDVAYSTKNINQKFLSTDSMFETMLNVNRNVVVETELEKEHDLASIHDELEEFFKKTKSDVLFVLNEGHNIFGLITFGTKVSGDHFKTSDRMIFEKLYSYFFVFGYYMRNISNKDVIGVVNREIKMSSQIITSIQENIDKINNNKCDVGYLMVPAHNIGGEFIDFIRLTDTRHLLVVGDISGKGIAASMNMVILKSIIRTYLAETHDFKQLVVKVNSFIRDSLRKGTIFAGTFALIDFETDTLYYINCGIPALMLYTQVYNNVIEIQGSGHVLGFVKDISPYISVKSTKLNSGDIILACTDGLIQSHSLRGEQFGKERVQQAILDNSTYPAQRMAQFTFDGLLKFMSKEMEDDVSILVIKYGNPDDLIQAQSLEESEESEANAEGSENNENPENSEENTAPTEETAISEESPVENQPDLDSFGVEDSEQLDIENAVNEKKSEEVEKKNELPDDFELPEGVPDLSDLDSLLKDAGL